MRILLALLLLLTVPGVRATERAGAASSCPGALSEDTISAATPEGEVRLSSGTLAKLAGLRLPDEPSLRALATAWLAQHDGRRVIVAAGPADRWGRAPARIVLEGGAGLDLAHGLIEEGLALVDTGEANRLCAIELLAIEATARKRGLGLWAGRRYKPVAAEDISRLRALIGGFALVEGRVRSVGERRARTYLNFGADWTSDFTITIPKRTWTMLQARGISAAGLRGRRVRARGRVEEWQGPALELSAAEMLELLDEDRGRDR